MAKTQVDYSRALKKIRRANKDALKQGSITIQQILKEGVFKAKATAPFDTGLTAKSVRSKFYDRNNMPEGLIIAPNAHRKEFMSRKKGKDFNLTRYMHNPNNFHHFKRARPDFMNLTREYLKKRAPDMARRNIKERIRIKYSK